MSYYNGKTLKPISEDRGMANGMRNTSKTPLTDEEIGYVRSEILRIEADPTVFVFNDEDHIKDSTCYNYVADQVFVTRNVFPDERFVSSHPRDNMSVAAVLAHEYYGHYKSHPSKYEPEDWRDEFQASHNAAVNTPNLTDEERAHLMIDAYDRAKEAGAFEGYDETARRIIYGF